MEVSSVGSESRIHIKVLSSPRGCHDPIEWLLSPERTIQLLLVSRMLLGLSEGCSKTKTHSWL
jgi:hypothetical protein